MKKELSSLLGPASRYEQMALQHLFILIERSKLQKLLLTHILQAPGTSRASRSGSQANPWCQQNLIGHWQNIVTILTNYLNVSIPNNVWIR